MSICYPAISPYFSRVYVLIMNVAPGGSTYYPKRIKWQLACRVPQPSWPFPIFIIRR